MNIKTFNLAIAIGWLLIAVGVGLHDIGAGMAIGGALALALTFLSARLFGVVQDEAEEGDAAGNGEDA